MKRLVNIRHLTFLAAVCSSVSLAAPQLQNCIGTHPPSVYALNALRYACIWARTSEKTNTLHVNAYNEINSKSDELWWTVFLDRYFQTGRLAFDATELECREALSLHEKNGSNTQAYLDHYSALATKSPYDCTPVVPTQYQVALYNQKPSAQELKAVHFVEACYFYQQPFQFRGSIGDSLLRIYVSTFHWAVNSALRKDFSPQALQQETCQQALTNLPDIVAVMNRELMTYPTFQGTVYRRITLDEAGYLRFLSEHRLKSIVSYPSYTSTSKTTPIDTGNKPIVVNMKIHSRSGYDLSDTLNSDEREVLFKPNTPFVVESLKENFRGGVKTLSLELTEIQ